MFFLLTKLAADPPPLIDECQYENVFFIEGFPKGEIQCPVLPNQICFLTNHNKFHVADLLLLLLLLSTNQKQWFTGNGASNVVFTLGHS